MPRLRARLARNHVVLGAIAAVVTALALMPGAWGSAYGQTAGSNTFAASSAATATPTATQATSGSLPIAPIISHDPVTGQTVFGADPQTGAIAIASSGAVTLIIPGGALPAQTAQVVINP